MQSGLSKWRNKRYCTQAKKGHGPKENVNLMHRNCQNADICARITVHKCCTQLSMEQFRLSFLLASRRSLELSAVYWKKGARE